MIKKATFGLAGAVLAGLLAAPAGAAVLMTEPFSYPDGPLVGQDGWVQTGTTVTAPLTVTSGTVPMVQGSAQDANRPFGTAVTTDSIYYAVDVNYASKNATADYAVHLSDGGTSAFGARLSAISSGTGYALAWQGSSTAAPSFGAELAFGTTYHVIFRYDIVAGAANDVGKLYVTTGTFNPTEASNTPYQDVTTWTGGTEVASFAAANLRQGTNSGTPTVDNFVVATTFTELVPEPGSLGLLAFAGLLAARRGSRR